MPRPLIFSASQDAYVVNDKPVHLRCYPMRRWGVPGTPPTALDYVRLQERIVISVPLAEWELADLKEVSRQYPLKGLSVSDHQGAFEDLEWMRGFEHVQSLIFHAYGATSFEMLSGFTSLRHLVIGWTRSARPSLAFLANCEKLEEAYLQGANKGLESVASLDRLKVLRLPNLKARSLEFLSEHPSIERMELLYASIRDFTPLAAMRNLRRLWIARVRGLVAGDLAPLSGASLDMLALNDAPRVETLEALGRPQIRHLSVDNLPKLRTLESLRRWPKLEVLGLRGSIPSDGSLVEAAKNPHLRHLAIAQRLPHDELRAIQRVFCGDSLWYWGEYLWGTDQPPDIIAGRTDL